MIFLDYAATTPIDQHALDIYVKASKKYFGNPSSLHDIGSEADEMLTVCRKEFANLIGGEDGVYFTSGGSESNILAIRSLIDGNKEKGNHLITTEVEHSSVYNLFKQLESEGYDVTYLPIDSDGQIKLESLEKAIQENTILASIHHGNSEIGAVQPLEEIGYLLHEHDVIFHADCVQTFGKIPIDIKKYYLDSLSVSSHKIYGPKGVGACYINPKVKWQPQQAGTTHESGFKPGTVNVPGILSFIGAAQLAISKLVDNKEKHERLRAFLKEKLIQINHEITVYGESANNLPGIVGLTISGIQGQYVMLECNRNDIAISTGSACQVGQQSPSRTMLSIGKSEDEAKQFIRISFGSETEEAHIDKLVNVFQHITEKVKGVL